jgi:tight adherence protein B
MIDLILLSFLTTIILLVFGVSQIIFQKEKKLEKRLQHYFSLPEKKVNPNKINLAKTFMKAKKKISKRVITKEKNEKLEIRLARAGLAIKAEEFILFQWILTAFSACLLEFITGQWLFILVGAIPGYLFPNWYLQKKIRDRVRHFNDGLTDMITTVVGSLRAGFSFPQALKTVVEEAAPPIKDEMESVLKEMQYGTSLEDALNNLKERMPSEDLDLMIQAILIQRQVGGNLATVLDKIVETIRDRTKIQRQIHTLTAQGRLSGIVVGLLPIILGFFLYLIQPTYIGTLFHHPIGLMMLTAGAISGIIGFLMIKKITTIEV